MRHLSPLSLILILCAANLQAIQWPKSLLALTSLGASIAGLIHHQQKYPNNFRSHFTAATPWWYLSLIDKESSPCKRNQIAALLDEHSSELSALFDEKKVAEFPWLPGFFVKTDISRIDGAKALKQYIQENKIKLVTVSEKWIYQSAAIDKPLVIAKKVKGPKGPFKINYAQAKDLCSVLANVKFNGSYYSDFEGGNLALDTQGRLVFIDTEKSSFGRLNPAEVYLLGKGIDDQTNEYIEEQLAKKCPESHLGSSLGMRIPLAVMIAKKKGLNDELARDAVRESLRRYTAFYDEPTKKHYDSKINDNLLFSDYSDLMNSSFTSSQKNILEKLEKSEYISPQKAFEYTQCIAHSEMCSKENQF